MHDRFLRAIWGEATALFDRSRKVGWVDLLVVLGLAGLLFELIDVAREWTGVHRQSVDIDLSPWALPRYAFFSLTRGLFAYLISLAGGSDSSGWNCRMRPWAWSGTA